MPLSFSDRLRLGFPDLAFPLRTTVIDRLSIHNQRRRQESFSRRHRRIIGTRRGLTMEQYTVMCTILGHSEDIFLFKINSNESVKQVDTAGHKREGDTVFF